MVSLNDRAQISSHNENRIDSVLSKAIDCLRFPLAFMVIYIHQGTFGFDDSPGFTPYFINLINALFVLVTPRIAVPVFFLISGYLYFYNVNRFSWAQYKDKTRKRCKTLVIPYICWNLINFAAVMAFIAFQLTWAHQPLTILTDYMSQIFSLRIFWDFYSWRENNWCFGMLPAEMSFPFDYPLWFVRNLIVLMFLSPVIYFLIRRFGKWVVVLLACCYLSSIWFQIPVLYISGVFFFTLGAYWGYNKVDISEVLRPYGKPLMISCGIFFVACVTAKTLAMSQASIVILPFYELTGVLAAILLMVKYVASGHDTSLLRRLANASFFIFAVHTICLNQWCAELIVRASEVFGSKVLTYSVRIIFEPILDLSICLAIFFMLKRFTPRLLGFLTGNRY